MCTQSNSPRDSRDSRDSRSGVDLSSVSTADLLAELIPRTDPNGGYVHYDTTDGKRVHHLRVRTMMPDEHDARLLMLENTRRMFGREFQAIAFPHICHCTATPDRDRLGAWSDTPPGWICKVCTLLIPRTRINPRPAPEPNSPPR